MEYTANSDALGTLRLLEAQKDQLCRSEGFKTYNNFE